MLLSSRAVREFSYDLFKMGKPACLGRYTDDATDWTIRGSNLGREEFSFFPPKRPDQLWNPSILLFSWYRGEAAGGGGC